MPPQATPETRAPATVVARKLEADGLCPPHSPMLAHFPHWRPELWALPYPE